MYHQQSCSQLCSPPPRWELAYLGVPRAHVLLASSNTPVLLITLTRQRWRVTLLHCQASNEARRLTMHGTSLLEVGLWNGLLAVYLTGVDPRKIVGHCPNRLVDCQSEHTVRNESRFGKTTLSRDKFFVLG